MRRILPIIVMMMIFISTSVSASIPGTTAAPRMPKGSINYIDSSTPSTHVNSKWENGTILSTIAKSAKARAESSFDVSGLSNSDEYVISFYTILPGGIGNWNGGIGITFAKSGESSFTILFQETIAVLLNETGLDVDIYSAKAPTDVYFKVDIHVKPSPDLQGKTWARFYLNDVPIKSGRSQQDYIEFDTLGANFGFYTSNWAADSDIQGLRVFKVDNTATEFEAAYNPKPPVTNTPTLVPTQSPASSQQDLSSSQESTEQSSIGDISLLESSSTYENSNDKTDSDSSSNDSDKSDIQGNSGLSAISQGSNEGTNENSKVVIFVMIAVLILAGGGVAAYFILKKVK